jgi:hypothetical protein
VVDNESQLPEAWSEPLPAAVGSFYSLPGHTSGLWSLDSHGSTLGFGRTERLGRLPEHCDEPEVALVESLSRCLAESMEERRGGSRELLWLVLGIHREDCLDAEHGLMGLAPPKSRFLLDGLYQGGHASPIAFR